MKERLKKELKIGGRLPRDCFGSVFEPDVETGFERLKRFVTWLEPGFRLRAQIFYCDR